MDTEEYCCKHKCFKIPYNYNELPCNRCNSNICVCKCSLINLKIQKFVNKILKKAKSMADKNLIGIKIINGRGYIVTNCRRLPKNYKNYYNPNELYYLYTDTLDDIPDLNYFDYNSLELVEKTYISKIYYLDMEP
jgi:hypothetical protein